MVDSEEVTPEPREQWWTVKKSHQNLVSNGGQ